MVCFIQRLKSVAFKKIQLNDFWHDINKSLPRGVYIKNHKLNSSDSMKMWGKFLKLYIFPDFTDGYIRRWVVGAAEWGFLKI